MLVGLLPRPRRCPARGPCSARWCVIDLFGQVSAAVPLDPGRLAVHARPEAARRAPCQAAALLWLCLAAVALSAVGLAALRRRDVG